MCRRTREEARPFGRQSGEGYSVDVASRARFDALLKSLPAAQRGAVIESLKLLVAALEPALASASGHPVSP
jgi:hypothetical protein